jgi:hypothetical protein
MRAKIIALLVAALAATGIVWAASATATGTPGLPLAHDLSVQVAENSSIQYFLPVDRNPGYDLTFTLVTPPAHGTVTGNGGPQITQTYTPAAGYTGPDTYTYRANQEDAPPNVSSTATVTLDVEPNALPGASESVAAGTPFTFTSATSTTSTTGGVTAPNAGTDFVSIDPSPASPPNAVAFTSINETAPPATSAAPNAVSVSFTDGTLTQGTDPSQWNIWHDGTELPNCADASGAANPDPCVAARIRPYFNSAIVVTILTSTNGNWVLGLDDLTPTITLGSIAYPYENQVVQGQSQIIGARFTPTEPVYVPVQVTYTDTSTTPSTVLGTVPATSGLQVDDLPLGLHTVYASSAPALNLGAATSQPISFYVNPFGVYFAHNPVYVSPTPGVQYVGKPMELELQESYGITKPVTVTIIAGALPPGVTMNKTGVFSGTPTTVGNFPVTFSVADASKPAEVAIFPTSMPILPMAINVGVNTHAAIQTSLSEKLGVYGGELPLTWSVTSGELPPGLKLANTGDLSGTPTALGSYTFTVSVHDGYKAAPHTASATFTITVDPIAVSNEYLPTATVGKVYSSYAMKTDGGKGSKKWVITSGGLPSGMKMSTTGVITGTPTQSGSFPITFRATDSAVPADSTAPTTFTLTVAALAITGPNGYYPVAGKRFTTTLKTNGGYGKLTWSIASGSLPAGLTLTSAGVVSGTPAAISPNHSNAYPVTLAVHDSAKPANTASTLVTFYVYPN